MPARGGAGRDAVARLRGDTKDLHRALKDGRKAFQRWGQEVKRDVARTMRGAFSGVMLAGTAGFAFQAREALQFEKRLTRLQISGRASAKEMANLRKQILAVAQATGSDSAGLLGAVEKFVADTGNIEMAAGMVETFGRVAAASGAELEEIAATASALHINLGLGAAEMEKAFSILIRQGKEGAVELRDMAALAAGLTPRFAVFGNKGVDAMAEMSAVLQTIRSGFGTSAEAATGLEAMIGAIFKDAKKFEKSGIRIFDRDAQGNKRFREFTDIIFDVIDRTKGDPVALSKLFGRKEAIAAILPLVQKGRKEVDRLIESAQAADDVGVDATTFITSDAGKMSRALEAMKANVNEIIAKHADSIAKAFEAIAAAVDFIVKHPIVSALGVGTLKFGPTVFEGVRLFREMRKLEAAAGAGGAVKDALEGAGEAAGTKLGLAAKASLVAAAGGIGFAIGSAINKWIDPRTDTAADKSNRRVAEAAGSFATAESLKLRQRAAQTPAGPERDRLLAQAEQLESEASAQFDPLRAVGIPMSMMKKLRAAGVTDIDQALKEGVPGIVGGEEERARAALRERQMRAVHKAIDAELDRDPLVANLGVTDRFVSRVQERIDVVVKLERGELVAEIEKHISNRRKAR